MNWNTMRAGITALGLCCCAALAPTGASAAEGDWQVRARALWVAPDEEADISQIGGDVSIDTSVVPEVDLSYFVTKHLALELIAAITPHTITAKNNPVGNVDLGDVWLLPPTLTLQYHLDPDGTFDPYVGAGVNYTHFFGADEPAGFDIEYDDSFGFALQAGVDVKVHDNVYVNLDVKKIFINTEASISNPLTASPIIADVDIDPWVVGVGLGIRF